MLNSEDGMRVSFTQLLAAAGEALPTNPWKAGPAWRLPHSQWLSLLCTAIMANGLMISASELSPATRDDPEVFFFTDPDVSLISGPNHWSTRAARTWFGNEAIEEKAASIPDEWQQQESFPHGVVPHRLLRDAIIDHRLEKCAEEFPCSDLFSPSSVRYGSDPMDKLSSRGSPHDWMAEAPIAESPLTTAEEISSEHMIFTLVQKYLEWEMREILQKRSARQWSECFELLPQVCHAPAPSVQGSPTMHGLWRMTSRSCVLPVSTQWLSDDSGATDLASHHHQDPFLELGHHDGLQSSADKKFSYSTSLILLIVLILLFFGFLRYQHGRAHQG
jgi:hypothetical protein